MPRYPAVGCCNCDHFGQAILSDMFMLVIFLAHPSSLTGRNTSDIVLEVEISSSLDDIYRSARINVCPMNQGQSRTGDGIVGKEKNRLFSLPKVQILLAAKEKAFQLDGARARRVVVIVLFTRTWPGASGGRRGSNFNCDNWTRMERHSLSNQGGKMTLSREAWRALIWEGSEEECQGWVRDQRTLVWPS